MPDIHVRSKKLSRQINRYFKSVDAEQHIHDLYSWMTGLPENQRPGVTTECLCRFSDFLEAVDKSYAEYEDKIKMVSRSLAISSQELNISNRSLEDLNETIRTMLDSLGQGLVFFNAEGMCSSVYSKACETLLDGPPGNKKIFNVLMLSSSQCENFHLWLEIVFKTSTALSFSDLSQLAPDHYINKNNQYIQLDYRPVWNLKNELSAVLLIATDKSIERGAAEALKETQALSQVIVSIAQNRNQFCNFIRNVHSLISDISDRGENDLLSTLRELHTYKGLAYHFGLENLGMAFHEAEDHIKAVAGRQKSINYASVLEDIHDELEEAISLAERLLGKDFLGRGRVRTVELAKIQYLKEKICELRDVRFDALTSFIDDEMLASSIEDCFSVFETELIRVAGVQGKPVPQISFHSRIHSLIIEDYGDFFETLIHLARNIMDHGIEMPVIRTKAGKPAEGRVDIYVNKIATETGGSLLRIIIQDDGQGFQMATLRARVESLHLYKGLLSGLPDETVLDYIFHPGFSTQSYTSLLSGRGIGMYALRKSVEALGGACQVHALHPGAEFVFDLPFHVQPACVSPGLNRIENR